ncbi:glycosyltransferase family 4 protein [Patescibacteria group bacterium]|nr:glycosyltransferase family 4 protein [Patescibacteria group bacterium]
MKILIINFEYPPLGGGGGVATQHIAEMLSKKHEVYVLTSRHPGLARREVTKGVIIERVAVIPRRELPTASLVSMASFVLPALWRAWRLTGSHRFEVINAQFAIPSGIPAALIASWRNIPFVLSFIGGDVYDPTKGSSPHRHAVLRWLVRRVARVATVCTAISEDTKMRANTLHGVEASKITVTHLGIEPQEVEKVDRATLGLPENVPLLVSVGRLIPRKDYRTALKIVAKVPRVHLAIVGEGPLREELARFAQDLGVESRVHFMGYLTEERKLQVLRSADVYLSTAEHEGFGIVFLEAMAAGLPVVAARVGGQVDFLTANENALLSEPGAVDQFTQQIERLLDDDVLRQRLSDNNKKKVPDFYLDKTVARFEAILTGAVSKPQQISGPNPR